MKILYKHVHLVIDDKREYLDGSILINDGIIEDVFVQSNKSFDDANEIDMNGKIFIPKFFDSNKKDSTLFMDPLSKLNESAKAINDITVSTIIDFNSDKGINYAFSNKYYVEFGIDDSLKNEYITFILKNINSDKLLLINRNHDDIYKQIKRLISLGVSLTNIVAMTSINFFNLYGNSKQDGYLIKGKPADIVCLDENFNKVFEMTKGEKDA